MKKLLLALMATLTLAGAASAESSFTIANKGGWYIIGVTAYKTGNHTANESFENFSVHLGQEMTFSSKDWTNFDVRVEVNTFNPPPWNYVRFDNNKQHIILHAYGSSGHPQFYWNQIDHAH